MPTSIPSKLNIKNNPTLPVADATLIKGAHQSVTTTTDRDAIDASARIAYMRVTVADINKTYELQPDLTTWKLVLENSEETVGVSELVRHNGKLNKGPVSVTSFLTPTSDGLYALTSLNGIVFGMDILSGNARVLWFDPITGTTGIALSIVDTDDSKCVQLLAYKIHDSGSTGRIVALRGVDGVDQGSITTFNVDISYTAEGAPVVSATLLFKESQDFALGSRMAILDSTPGGAIREIILYVTSPTEELYYYYELISSNAGVSFASGPQTEPSGIAIEGRDRIYVFTNATVRLLKRVTTNSPELVLFDYFLEFGGGSSGDLLWDGKYLWVFHDNTNFSGAYNQRKERVSVPTVGAFGAFDGKSVFLAPGQENGYPNVVSYSATQGFLGEYLFDGAVEGTTQAITIDDNGTVSVAYLVSNTGDINLKCLRRLAKDTQELLDVGKLALGEDDGTLKIKDGRVYSEAVVPSNSAASTTYNDNTGNPQLNASNVQVALDNLKVIASRYTYVAFAGLQSVAVSSFTKQKIGSIYYDPTSIVPSGQSRTRQVFFEILLQTSNASFGAHAEILDVNGISNGGTPIIIASSDVSTTQLGTTRILVDVSASLASTTTGGILDVRIWMSPFDNAETISCSGASLLVIWDN